MRSYFAKFTDLHPKVQEELMRFDPKLFSFVRITGFLKLILRSAKSCGNYELIGLVSELLPHNPEARDFLLNPPSSDFFELVAERAAFSGRYDLYKKLVEKGYKVPH